MGRPRSARTPPLPSHPVDRKLARVLARSLRMGTRALYGSGPFFDHFYRRRTRDVRFYVEVARRYGGPVLELGVGTGRVALGLARAGFEVEGVDLMPSMLRYAQARAARLSRATQARIALRRADMRSLALGQRFGLVIAPFNAFTHLYSLRDLERTLEVCLRHLQPRGRLVFDVVMPDLRALTRDPERAYRGRDLTLPRDGRRYAYSEASHYDAVRQIRSVTMLLERAGEPATGQAIPLTQRQFFPAELAALLHYNGFEIEHRYGDFLFGPLTDQSEEQIIVAHARKPRKR